MGRREDNKRRTRDALIARGLELYRDVGFDETRVQDIVDKVGVSPATFFNYFPTKEAILEAKADETADLYATLLQHELERPEIALDVRLKEITRLVADSMSADPAISRLMAIRTGLFFGAEGTKADKDRAAQHLLGDLFTQGQSNR
ncbi:MAG: TetR/AcrR family transcriptional regulator [Acidimicrobiales bacterium]